MKPELHYTIVEISELRAGAQSLSGSIIRLKESIRVKFAHYLEEVQVSVNGERVLPVPPELLPGTRIEIDVETRF